MSGSTPLSPQEREQAFKRATSGFAKHYAAQIEHGMSDEELERALAIALGRFGGSCDPNQLHITYKGSGLKIWASHEIHNHVTAAPLFEGRNTLQMAREVYAIPDPDNAQLSLL